jgi:hypothetical protein
MRKFLILCMVLASISMSCGKDEIRNVKKETKDSTNTVGNEKNSGKKDSALVIELTPEIDTSGNNYYNNISRFIAGEDIKFSSVFDDHIKTAVYKNYKNAMSNSWNTVYKNRLSSMKEWYADKIEPDVEDSLNLLYPFSGPDVLHSFTFYPYAHNYFFIALENTGSLPPIEKMKISNVSAYLYDLNQSIKDVMSISYFLTKKMMVALKRDKVDGALPVLCLFIAKTGNTILSYESLYMNGEGKFSNDKDSNFLTPCLKIVFKNNNSNYIQNIYYFKQDLSDGKNLNNSGVLEFVKSGGKFNTYVKAASYLMHLGNFSSVRNLILENSNTVLEDDTGIPYKYFDSKIWDKKFYGEYVAPITLFQIRNQPDLKAAFKNNKKGDLPFNMGYHIGNAKLQNILFFSRIRD